MKKTILVLSVVLAVLSSCVTQRKCNYKFPAKNDTIRIETIRDSIVIKDTTIYIILPGETVTDSVIIPCPDPGPAYIPKRVIAETSLARAEAWWSYPNIKLTLIQKDTTIERRLEGAIKEAHYWKTEYEKITVTPQPEKHIPGFYRFCTFCFMGIVLAGVGFAGFKLLS